MMKETRIYLNKNTLSDPLFYGISYGIFYGVLAVIIISFIVQMILGSFNYNGAKELLGNFAFTFPCLFFILWQRKQATYISFSEQEVDLRLKTGKAIDKIKIIDIKSIEIKELTAEIFSKKGFKKVITLDKMEKQAFRNLKEKLNEIQGALAKS